MLFKWNYHDCDDAGSADTLMMGSVRIGQVYQSGKNLWRAVCDLPDSAQNGGMFIGEYPSSGIAKSTLEIAAAMWVNKAALWTTPVLVDRLAENNPKQG